MDESLLESLKRQLRERKAELAEMEVTGDRRFESFVREAIDELRTLITEASQ